MERTKPKKPVNTQKNTVKTVQTEQIQQVQAPTIKMEEEEQHVKNKPQNTADTHEEMSVPFSDDELVDMFTASVSLQKPLSKTKRADRSQAVNMPISITPLEPQVQTGIYRIVQFYDTETQQRWIPAQCQHVCSGISITLY